MPPAKTARLALTSLLLMASPALAQQPAAPVTEAHGWVQLRRTGDAVQLLAPGLAPMTLAGSAPAVESASTPLLDTAWVRTEGESGRLVVLARAHGAASAAVLFDAARRQGELGEARNFEALVRPLGAGGAPVVLVGARQDGVRLCGVGRPLVQAAAAAVGQPALRPVVLNPLRADLLETPGPDGVARNAGLAPGAFVPVTPGAASVEMTASGGRAMGPVQALLDARPATAWSARAHDWVTLQLRLAGEPIERVELVAPAAPAVLPRRFTLLFGGTPGARYEVSLPEGLRVPPGGVVSVPVVPPVASDCLSLVVTEGAEGATAIAELAVRSGLERALADLPALVLRLDGPQGDALTELLEAQGERAVGPLAAALPTLPLLGARRALRVLGHNPSEAATRALLLAAPRDELRAELSALLVRRGAAVLPLLASALSTQPALLTTLLALPAPPGARFLAALPLAGAERPVWHTAQGALRSLARQVDSAPDELRAVLAALPEAPLARARVLALLASQTREREPRRTLATAALAVSDSSFPVRFLLLGALAGGPDGRARVNESLEGDDADLRAEAARALGNAPDIDVETLQGMLDDPAPRVRLEAVRALPGVGEAQAALVLRSRNDRWPTVRAAALRTLGAPSGREAGLLAALDDPSPMVVRTAFELLAEGTLRNVAEPLMHFAEDPSREATLRAEAVSVLGHRCERAMAERLATLFDHQNDPVLPQSEQLVGHAALAALARVDPVRLRRVTEGMELNGPARAALARAVARACPAPGAAPAAH